MSDRLPVYLLDANVFIQAKRRFYPFDVCPGYWEALCWHRTKGTVMSLDKVADELERGGDDLWDWAKHSFHKEGFVPSQSSAGEFGRIVTWVQAGGYQQEAKAEFMNVADGWLAAHALQSGCVVVTLEELKDNAKRVVPLANVCREFGVEMITPFEMLRRLGVTLSWQAPS